jgi:hypothetical protein
MSSTSAYNLFLDDVRSPSDCYIYINDERYVKYEWIIVRSHDDFVEKVNNMWCQKMFPSLVSFDHDLSREHHDSAMHDGVDAYDKLAQRFIIPTGMNSAEYLVNFCKLNQLALPECLIHSMNPSGELRIRRILGMF